MPRVSGEIMKLTQTIVLLWFSSLIAAQGAVHVSNGSAASVQSKINAAVDGDTVTIPAGSFTWSTVVTIQGKGIKLQGAGARRVIARSTSTVTPGLGSKTFTITLDPKQSGIMITPGQTLRIGRLGEWNAQSMTGTVTSYNAGTGVLVMDITSFIGTTPERVWFIETESAGFTTIKRDDLMTGPMMEITEDASHHVEITGINFINDWGEENGQTMGWNPVPSGKPILLNKCHLATGSLSGAIRVRTNKGLVWNCSFMAIWDGQNQIAMGIQFEDYTHLESWTTPHTYGTADTTGHKNFYIEDTDFHSYLNSIDISSIMT